MRGGNSITIIYSSSDAGRVAAEERAIVEKVSHYSFVGNLDRAVADQYMKDVRDI
jgi:hypothetical protein